MNFNDIESEEEGKWESGSEASFEGEVEIEFKPSINAYERAGLPSAVAAMLGTNIGGELGELEKKINRLVQDPADRFAIYVDAISRSLINRDIVKLSQDDIESMLMPIRNIKNVEHKNPTAYILGYIASQGGRSLQHQIVEKVLKVMLPSVEDSSVKEPDVIRYARFWMILG